MTPRFMRCCLPKSAMRGHESSPIGTQADHRRNDGGVS
jgi:hypothetical protein